MFQLFRYWRRERDCALAKVPTVLTRCDAVGRSHQAKQKCSETEVAMSEPESEVKSVASGDWEMEKASLRPQGGCPVSGLQRVHDGGCCFHLEMR